MMPGFRDRQTDRQTDIVYREGGGALPLLKSFIPLKCFFGSEGYVALERNPGRGYHTLLLRLIPGDLLSACPHRHFHTLPGLLDSRAALTNSYPNALRSMQGGSLYHFYDCLWYDPAGRRTHDQPDSYGPGILS